MDTPGNGTSIQSGQNIYNIGVVNNANFGMPTESKPFNAYITKELLEAIKPYSKYATKFLDRVKDSPEWNQRADYNNQAKDILANSFVGVLSIQLRKLWSIGKEEMSDSKRTRYIDNCVTTAKRSLQILCFSLLSDMWNQAKEKKYSINEEQERILKLFFEDCIELRIANYSSLLRNLYTIYQSNNQQFPISELADFADQLLPDSKFNTACNKLHELNEMPDTAKYTLKNCEDVEVQLTDMLSSVGFLASYKMVSIKSIGYEEERNSSPRFLHNYVPLGADNKINESTERLNYVEDPVNSDAVFLFKGNYVKGINLFPFIIDMNALTNEAGVKICFFSFVDTDEKVMLYRFLEDDSEQSIAYKGTFKSDQEINELMEDKEKRKNMKLDSVFLQFLEAKKAILGADDED